MEAATGTEVRNVRFGGELKTLREVRSNFAHRSSPKLIALAVLAAAAARIAVGDIGWGDAAAAIAMLVVYPFGEWAIHVYLLHMKPFVLRGRKVETIAARAHRTHHRHPNDLDQLLLDPWQVGALLFGAVPLVAAAGGGIAALITGSFPVGPVLSSIFMGYVLVLVYEWTHFLIHTAYRPRTRLYRSVWRNHRLHHFKNERYWHGVTQNFSDRVLGTNPDHRQVERSRTARTLDAGPARR